MTGIDEAAATMEVQTHPAPRAAGSPSEVLMAFLKLGLTSFGGPIAHLGYFRDELVLRRRWIDEAAYADLVALCQFLRWRAGSWRSSRRWARRKAGLPEPATSANSSRR